MSEAKEKKRGEKKGEERKKRWLDDTKRHEGKRVKRKGRRKEMGNKGEGLKNGLKRTRSRQQQHERKGNVE
jgi:hypothetical protein